MIEPYARFLGKAQAYASGRPTYPAESLRQLIQATQLPTTATVYDVGAGTGLFTQLLLGHFDRVNIVEPNADMRAEAQKVLPPDRVDYIDAYADSFPAEPHSADLITAASAWHWFPQPQTVDHWKSILKPQGFAVIAGNGRQVRTQFDEQFRELQRTVGKRDPQKPQPVHAPDEEMVAYFRQAEIFAFDHTASLTEQQTIDFLYSRSYAPLPGEHDYESTQEAIRALFRQHQIDGHVEVSYTAKLYIGKF